jgi:prepilin-type processing-associated H-X9-DG protein
VDKYMSRGQTEVHLFDVYTGYYEGATSRKHSQAFRCPSVARGDFNQQVHYYNHGVAMPHIPLELNAALQPVGQPPVKAPAKMGQLYPETALFWDTPCYSLADPATPSMFWIADGITGYSLGCTRIDDDSTTADENPLLGRPDRPERRYRGRSGDRFATSTNPLRHFMGPIAWPTDKQIVTWGGDPDTMNADVGGGATWNYGGPRYRHNGLGTNVVFADGSVRTLFLNTRRVIKAGGAEYWDSEFRRNMLMIKWPQDKRDTNTVSTD